MANKLIQDLTTTAFALTDLLEKQPVAGPPSTKGNISALVTLLNTVYGTGPFVAKAGDTMTGGLTIAQATANATALIVSGYSLTGANAQSLISFAGTWNTSGTPTAWAMEITDTASNAASVLADWKLNGITKFKMSKNGALYVTNTIEFATPDNTPLFVGTATITGANSTITALFDSAWLGTGTPTGLQVAVDDFGLGTTGAESFLFNAIFTGVSAFSIRKDGLVRVFNRINFLGDTSAFPSLKRSATVLQSRLADDSNFSPLQGLLRTAANAVTGLTPGALAALSNASIVIADASGQAYRVPCII